MLGVSLRDHIPNQEIRRTGVGDVVEIVAKQKWRWEGHVGPKDNSRWPK